MESCWKNPKRKPRRAQLRFLLSLSKWRTSTLKVTFWNVQKKGYSQATRLLTLKKKVLQICKTPGKEREKNTLIKCHINKKPVQPQASQETHTWCYIMGTKDGSCSELAPHYWLQNKSKSKGEMGGSSLMKKDGRERNLNLRNRTGHTGVSGQMGSVKRTELTAHHHKLCKTWSHSQKHLCPFYRNRSWCMHLEVQHPHQHLLPEIICTSMWLCIHIEGHGQVEHLPCTHCRRSCAHLNWGIYKWTRNITHRLQSCERPKYAAYRQALLFSRLGYAIDSCT